MTDWNIRDIFELCTGRCGHKWVVPLSYRFERPVCGDCDDHGRHVVAREPITVSIAYVWDKLERRRTRAIRATIVLVTARQLQQVPPAPVDD